MNRSLPNGQGVWVGALDTGNVIERGVLEQHGALWERQVGVPSRGESWAGYKAGSHPSCEAGGLRLPCTGKNLVRLAFGECRMDATPGEQPGGGGHSHGQR